MNLSLYLTMDIIGQCLIIIFLNKQIIIKQILKIILRKNIVHNGNKKISDIFALITKSFNLN